MYNSINKIIVQISYHGFFHSSIVYQILNGFIPPQEPGLADIHVSRYWLYHLFLAAIVQYTEVSPLISSTILRVTSLISSYLASVLILKHIGFRGKSWLLAFPILNCISLLEIFYQLEIFDIYFSQIRSGFDKYWNFTSAGYVFAIFNMSIYLLIDKSLSYKAQICALGLLILGSIMFGVYIYPAILIVAFVFSYLFYKKAYKPANEKISSVLILLFIITLVIPISLFWPYLSSFVSSYSYSDTQITFQELIFNHIKAIYIGCRYKRLSDNTGFFNSH